MKKLICPKCGSERIQQVQDGVTVFNDMSIDPDGDISYDLVDAILEDVSTVVYLCKHCGEWRDILENFIIEEEK